jgi:preprotein translocase subunit SecA
MDDLKQSVQNASYEQKDPLLIYKFEAFNLFKAMLDKVNKDVLSFLFKGELPAQGANQISEAPIQKHEKLNLSKEEVQNMTESSSRNPHDTREQRIVETVVREERKIGRNEKVTIKNVINGENKEVKFKQAIPLLDKGDWVLVD